MDLFYDLHIHSCLSPCGDDAMTPAAIAGFAKLKGLDVIALTDHNTVQNCPAFLRAAHYYDILALPGMELTTSEEVHVVCLFASLKQAMEFDAYVQKKLVPFPNDTAVFGRQIIVNEEDEPIGTIQELLINRTEISFDTVPSLMEQYCGVMFPAHIDKTSNSLLSNLGFIPPDSQFQTVGVADMRNLHRLKKENPYLEQCLFLSNSDAHYLQDIHDPHMTISVTKREPDAVLERIRRGQQGLNE